MAASGRTCLLASRRGCMQLPRCLTARPLGPPCFQVAAGPGVPPGAVGGFGHTLSHSSGQRVDVAGHVSLRCGLLGLLASRIRQPERRRATLCLCSSPLQVACAFCKLLEVLQGQPPGGGSAP